MTTQNQPNQNPNPNAKCPRCDFPLFLFQAKQDIDGDDRVFTIFVYLFKCLKCNLVEKSVIQHFEMLDDML